MPKPKKPPLPWVVGSAAALLAGLLAGPVVLYWIGGNLAGDYSDPAGLLALWAGIYGDALRGGGGGLAFLLGPLLMFQVAWFAVAALGRLQRLIRPEPGARARQRKPEKAQRRPSP